MLVAEENKTFSVADVEALFPTMTPVETNVISFDVSWCSNC
jgi:hypothetical protein